VESANPPENLKGRMGVVSMMGSLKNVGIRLSNETEWLGLVSDVTEVGFMEKSYYAKMP
jgi:hypothetical protein